MTTDSIFRAIQRQLCSLARPLRLQDDATPAGRAPCDWCRGPAREEFELGRREGAAAASREIQLAMNDEGAEV